MTDMSPTTQVETWDILKRMGFKDDASVLSARKPGLSLKTGGLDLSVSQYLAADYSTNVVFVSGHYQSSNNLKYIEFEMPLEMESVAQGLAWLVYRVFGRRPRRVPENPAWLQTGIDNYDLLPWEKQRIEREQQMEQFIARPHCRVERDWFRVARKKVKTLASESPDAEVTICFDQRTLSFSGSNLNVIMPAVGDQKFSCRLVAARLAKAIRNRFQNAVVTVGLLDNVLDIDSTKTSVDSPAT